MKQCPACNAKYTGKRLCHRCKNNLGDLVDIEDRARNHLKKATEAFASDNVREMFFHAKRSCSLRRTQEATKLLAYAALLVSQPGVAMNQWTLLNDQ